MFDAGRVERRLHAVDEAAGNRALPAEVHERLARAAPGQLRAHLLFRPAAEHEMRGRYELEILHGSSPFRKPSSLANQYTAPPPRHAPRSPEAGPDDGRQAETVKIRWERAETS